MEEEGKRGGAGEGVKGNGVMVMGKGLKWEETGRVEKERRATNPEKVGAKVG